MPSLCKYHDTVSVCLICLSMNEVGFKSEVDEGGYTKVTTSYKGGREAQPGTLAKLEGMGEEKAAQEGGNIITTDSCCCTAETNTTLQSNFPPIKKIKEGWKNDIGVFLS